MAIKTNYQKILLQRARYLKIGRIVIKGIKLLKFFLTIKTIKNLKVEATPSKH